MNDERRTLLLSAAATVLAAPALAQTSSSATPDARALGTEHWTTKRTPDGDVRLFLWRKLAASAMKGVILFVHGSSVSGRPAFDLQVPGKPEYSFMDWFGGLGYDAWCVDCEGYGRSDKRRPINSDIATGADDVAAAVDYIRRQTGMAKIFIYGSSSGALRAALYAQRNPQAVARLAVTGFTWTGEGSPTLEQRRKRLADYRANNRRPIDRAMIRSIFTRDGGEGTDMSIVEPFADAVLAFDTSVPSGSYVDMSANLPLVDPQKITVPVYILRGENDGIATLQDLANFFVKLSNPQKQLSVLPGIAHSPLGAKNWRLFYQTLDACFTQPAPIYTG